MDVESTKRLLEESADSREERLAALIALCSDRLNAGEEVDTGAMLAEHSDLEPELSFALGSLGLLGKSGARRPEVLGDYEIGRRVGRGGMGVVYEAHQKSMERRVALKVLPAGLVSDPRALSRFAREARVTGQLHHPNIVPVHAMGVEDGVPYFAMEYVEGETLAKLVAQSGGRVASARGSSRKKVNDRTRADTATKGEAAAESLGVETTVDESYCREMAAAFAGVAEGLHYAHGKGVIHRDIKPSNLIRETGGRLRILDFGLARLEGQESLTLSGDLLGTPAYMSPEQAAGAKRQVDHRTDIYSLGATLYEVLTRQSPSKGRSHQETLSQIIERDPRPPRQLNPRVPVDLETIVLKCLRKDATERYGTAAALTQDLRRFAHGELIEARPERARARFARRLKRHRTAIAVAAAFLGLLLSGVWLNVQRESAEKQRRQAERRHMILASALVENLRSGRETDRESALAELRRVAEAILRLGTDNSSARHFLGVVEAEEAYDERPHAPTDRGTDTMQSTRGSMIESAEVRNKWTSYFGGPGVDSALALAVGRDGSVYVGGMTTHQSELPTGDVEVRFGEGGGPDAVVAKFSSDGSTLLWSAVLGGPGKDMVYGVDVNSHGVVTISGQAAGGFPTTTGALAGDGEDAFVAQLDPSVASAEQLLFSTRLGGRAEDGAFGVFVHGGLVTIAGFTKSTDFPSTQGALLEEYQGGVSDLFVARLDPDRPEESLVYSTFLGTPGHDLELNGGAIAGIRFQHHMTKASDGTVVVATHCVSSGMPTTTNAHQRHFIGAGDASDIYVAQLDPAADGDGQLVYGSYLGTPGYDAAQDVAVDDDGNIFVLAYSWSASFPLTGEAWDRIFGGDREGTLTRLGRHGRLTYSTFLGGSGNEYNGGLLVLPGNKVLVADYTDSRDYPVLDGSTYRGGKSDVVFTLLDLDDSSDTFGEALDSTYFGGQGEDFFRTMERTPDGRVAAVGYTTSEKLGTDDAFQPDFGGKRDMLIATFAVGVRATSFLRGDCNDDSAIDIADGLCILNWLFSDGTAPGCVAALNVNGDTAVNTADPIALLSFLFVGGVAPEEPFPDCGTGSSEADAALGCETLPRSCQ